jgi:predicted PurR-regulated permease PerM
VINKFAYNLKIAMPFIIIVFFMLIFIFSPDKINFVISALNPVITSFVIAYLLDSLVKSIMKRLRVKRTAAIFLSCTCLLCAILIMFAIFIPMLIENAEAVIKFMTSYKMDISSIMSDIAKKIDNQNVYRISDEITKLSSNIKEQINNFLNLLALSLVNLAKDIGTRIISLFTNFILTIYMLIEKDDLIARLKRLILALFDERKANTILDVSASANRIFKGYLVGKLLDSFIVGIITIIAFLIFKIPYAGLMGSIIGLFNIIPFFGPIIGSIPVIVVSFFISPIKAVIAFVITTVIGQIDGNLIEPKIVGNNVGVSPFWAISGVIIGGSAFGVKGMILGVPFLVLIKTITEEFVAKKLREKNMSNYQSDSMKVIDSKK